MRIVFLNTAAHGGGAETVLLDLLIALKALRPQWSLHLLLGEEGPLVQRATSAGVITEVLPFSDALRLAGDAAHQTSSNGQSEPPAALTLFRRAVTQGKAAIAALRYVPRLRARLRELQPDVVHSNGMKMHLLAGLAIPGATPLVWHLHDYLGARPLMAPVLRTLLSRCRLVIGNSASVAADARRILGPRARVEAVHNGIDPEVFTPHGPALDLDALSGLPPVASTEIRPPVRVGLVATFAFWKGHDVFLKAAAHLARNSVDESDKKRDLRFYVVGGPLYATPGSQRTLAELRALADSLGLGSSIGFTGFVEDVPAALRALDIVVHASTQPEPFGLAIVQAMSCGRAVIAADAGGASELVSAETDALTHLPGDHVDLARKMAQLADSQSLRTRLGSAARAKVERLFTRAEMGRRIAPLHEDLLASP